MQLNVKKTLLLVIVFSLLLTTVGFCGTWYNINFDMPSITKYETQPFYSYGEPSIKFWTKARYGSSTIKVTLYSRKYIAKPISEGGGWQYTPIQSITKNVTSNGEQLVMMDYREGFLRSNVYYKNEVINGSSVSIDGSVTYYK